MSAPNWRRCSRRTTARTPTRSPERPDSRPSGRNEEVFEQLESAFDTSDDEAFAEIANTLENTAAATHTSLLAEYESVNARKITASIIVVEARMATVLSDFGGLAADFEEVFEPDAEPLGLDRRGGVMNRTTTPEAASRYGRRDALKIGGLDRVGRRDASLRAATSAAATTRPAVSDTHLRSPIHRTTRSTTPCCCGLRRRSS